MSLQIVFLGTAASIPTPNRSLSAIAIKREGELLLFDCGEGTQRQMIRAKIGFNRKTKVFITHMHGDHVLGLPGILQTMSLLGRENPLEIYGPRGIRDFIEAIIRTVRFALSFQIEVHEVEDEGIIREEKGYCVHAVWAEHSVPTLAYALIEKPRPGRFHPERATALGVAEKTLWSRLQHGHEIELSNGRKIKPQDVMDPPRPGRKIVYTGDTSPSDKIVELAEDADLLIHEATFSDDLAERAAEDRHSTVSQAAEVASRAKAKLLYLTHISARYEYPEKLLEQAKKTFPNTHISEDLTAIIIPLHKDDCKKRIKEPNINLSQR